MAIQLSTETNNLYPDTKSLYIMHKLLVLLPEVYQLIDLNTYKELNEYIENMKICIKKNEDLAGPIEISLRSLEKRGTDILELHNLYLDLKKYIEDFKQKYENDKSDLYINEKQKYKELDKKLEKVVNDDIEKLLKLISDNVDNCNTSIENINEKDNRNDIITVGKLFENLYKEVDLIKESGL